MGEEAGHVHPAPRTLMQTGTGGTVWRMGMVSVDSKTKPEIQLLPCPESFRDLWDKYVTTCLLRTPFIYQQKQQDYKVVNL